MTEEEAKIETLKRLSPAESVEKCPHCKSVRIRKNGHKDKSQRYLCQTCGKTFCATTGANHIPLKKDYETFERFIDCVLNGETIRFSAAICKINKSTALAWRKIVIKEFNEIGYALENKKSKETPVKLKKKKTASRNDEFYTVYFDIENEISKYDKSNFKDKTILLPCNDGQESKFTQFFIENFFVLGLKKLIATSFSHRKAGRRYLTVTKDSYAQNWKSLKSNGDFRGEEITKFRDEADIVITNPPFSLFSEFIKWIVSANKKFLIIGNINAATYKAVFPLIKSNMVRIDSASIDGKGMQFETPNNKTKEIPAVWYTNLEGNHHNPPITLSDRKIGTYPRYDNYNAIEVTNIKAIPRIHDVVMGVPISFLKIYCPEQFEIIGTSDRGGDGMIEHLKIPNQEYNAPIVNSKKLYKRIFIRLRK